MKNAKIYVLQVNFFSRFFFTNHFLKVPKFLINSDYGCWKCQVEMKFLFFHNCGATHLEIGKKHSCFIFLFWEKKGQKQWLIPWNTSENDLQCLAKHFTVSNVYFWGILLIIIHDKWVVSTRYQIFEKGQKSSYSPSLKDMDKITLSTLKYIQFKFVCHNLGKHRALVARPGPG